MRKEPEKEEEWSATWNDAAKEYETLTNKSVIKRPSRAKRAI